MTTAPILVPLDGSVGAENALPFAVMAHRVYGAPLHFVQVIDQQSASAADQARANELFADYGRSLAETWKLPAAECRFQVFTGSPAITLLDLAKNAAMVVLASHGRGGFRAFVLGSVADKVVRAATVPVLMVPAVGSPPPEPETILVTLDGSDEAERALEPARRIASAISAKIVLICAYQYFDPIGGAYAYVPPEALSGFEADATTYLAKVVGPGEQTTVYQGDASQSIVAAAAALNAGLVVMTKSGKGRAKRIALGSTTDRVLHSLHRPVLVIPPAD